MVLDEEPTDMHMWVNPPETELPLSSSPCRVAVGTPSGPSTNSWRIWVHGDDVYVKCRDHFREFKVSLHASGIWRVAFTEEFIRSRPDFLPEGKDRVLKRWQPSFADPTRPVIGFQVAALTPTLHLKAQDRRSWPDSVVFVEPPADNQRMAVLSVTVVQSHKPLRIAAGTRGAVIAVLPLGEHRTVQVVATHESPGDITATIEDEFRKAAHQLGGPSAFPEEGLFFVWGNRDVDIPWVTAVPFQRLDRQEGA